MQYILYLVLFTYALPLIGVIISAVLSNFFQVNDKSIYVASAISAINASSLRDIFGSIIVPLVTTYSIHIGPPGEETKIPLATKSLFTVFIILFISSSIFYGIVVSNADSLKNYSEDIFNTFRNITAAHMKEALIYVAMTLGITVKKQTEAKQGGGTGA